MFPRNLCLSLLACFWALCVEPYSQSSMTLICTASAKFSKYSWHTSKILLLTPQEDCLFLNTLPLHSYEVQRANSCSVFFSQMPTSPSSWKMDNKHAHHKISCSMIDMFTKNCSGLTNSKLLLFFFFLV